MPADYPGAGGIMVWDGALNGSRWKQISSHVLPFPCQHVINIPGCSMSCVVRNCWGAVSCLLQLWEIYWQHPDEDKHCVTVQPLQRIQGVPKIFCRSSLAAGVLSEQWEGRVQVLRVVVGKYWSSGWKPCPNSTSVSLVIFCISDLICCINRLLNPPESMQAVLRSQRIEMLFWKARVSSTHWKLADEILKALKFLEEQWVTKDIDIIMLQYSVIFNAVHSECVCK